MSRIFQFFLQSPIFLLIRFAMDRKPHTLPQITLSFLMFLQAKTILIILLQSAVMQGCHSLRKLRAHIYVALLRDRNGRPQPDH